MIVRFASYAIRDVIFSPRRFAAFLFSLRKKTPGTKVLMQWAGKYNMSVDGVRQISQLLNGIKQRSIAGTISH